MFLPGIGKDLFVFELFNQLQVLLVATIAQHHAGDEQGGKAEHNDQPQDEVTGGIGGYGFSHDELQIYPHP